VTWQYILVDASGPAAAASFFPAAAAAVQVESCKKRMNTFGFVGELAIHTC
jgi:hypothetical protein